MFGKKKFSKVAKKWSKCTNDFLLFFLLQMVRNRTKKNVKMVKNDQSFKDGQSWLTWLKSEKTQTLNI